jgi:DNA invertase Pin-like site-specific DNA recombinase
MQGEHSMTTKPRAIGIIRVSQRTDDTGQSPEVQRRALGQMAALHEWKLAARDVLDENVDNGRVRIKSGGASLNDRPKLAHAVEEIEAGKARILAAENFDRLFRNLEVQREVVRRVEAAGGEIWERSGRISHARAADKFTSTIKGASSEFVKDAAAERSWDAVELAIEQGKVPWPGVSPGYTRGGDGRLIPDRKPARVIRRAFELRAAGGTIEAVRDYLAKHGVERSYHGAARLLRDRLYLGEIHFGKHTPNLKAHEAIIDRDLFDRVQHVTVRRGPSAKSDRLLARQGVLRCASCGGRMVVGTQRQHGRSYPFYRCPGKGSHTADVRDCTARVAISAENVEALVLQYARSFLRDAFADNPAPRDEVRAAALKAVQAREALANAGRRFMLLPEGAARDGALEAIEQLQHAAEEAQTLAARLAAIGGVDRRRAIGVLDDPDATLADKRFLISLAVREVTVKPGRGPIEERVTIWPTVLTVDGVRVEQPDWTIERIRLP